MDETEKYINALLQQQGINSQQQFTAAFAEFVKNAENSNNVQLIKKLQEHMTKNWQIIARREELKNLQVALPNGQQGKPYHAQFNLDALGMGDVTAFTLTGFEDTGLAFNTEANVIEGTPDKGDIVLDFSYNFSLEEEGTAPNHKKITLIINPDPKLLWKNIPSDVGDVYAKPDDVVETATIAGKQLVAASRRGRSHANRGSFRDDDYAYAELPLGWGVVAVADGAGSARFSRKGSAIACKAVVESLTQSFSGTAGNALHTALLQHTSSDALKAALGEIAQPLILQAAEAAYTNIETFATQAGASVNDFHTTLAFVVFRQHEDGGVFLSYGVGDCAAALAAKDFNYVLPLDKIDSGDFGGGTRFITMPGLAIEPNRFSVEITKDFPYIVLMTDGIFDPKFEVEANLANTEKWSQFFNDLGGNNSEGIAIAFNDNDDEVAHKLSGWMDFWSTGNHDDRTLAIVY